MKTLQTIIASLALLTSVNASAGLIQSSETDFSRTNFTAQEAFELDKNKLMNLETASIKHNQVEQTGFYEKNNLNDLLINDDEIRANKDQLGTKNQFAFLDIFNR